MNPQSLTSRVSFTCFGWKPDISSLTSWVAGITAEVSAGRAPAVCAAGRACTSPVCNPHGRSGPHQRMSFGDTVYIGKEKRNLIHLQCCDKLLFPVVISESIRMDVVEGKWKLGVVIVASDAALGTSSVVLLALLSTAAMVVVLAAWDAAVVETSTVVEVVGRSNKQEQTRNLVKSTTQLKSQIVR